MRGDGFTPTARVPDNKFRDMLGSAGRSGLNSVAHPLAQQIQRKVYLFDWRSRRQAYSRIPATQIKGNTSTNNISGRSEHTGGVLLQSLATSKAVESSIASGGIGIHNNTDQHSQEKLHTDVPLNTFLLSAIDQDFPGALPANDLDSMQIPHVSSCQYAEYLDSLTRTQNTSKYDFCNPELYDDPFRDPIPTSDAHQINRVTPAQYTDNIPRIQRSLSIKQDSSGSLPGLYDPMARSMDFASLANKPRHRLGIGATALGITSSTSLANLLSAKGDAIPKSTSSKQLSKEKSRSSTTPRSTAFKSSLAHGQLSIDSDSRDSEVYPVGETSNLGCFKHIESDLSAIQENGSSPPPLPHIAAAIISTETPLSPGTPHVLQNGSTKRQSETTIKRTNTTQKIETKATIPSSNEESCINDGDIPVTLESLNTAISAPNPTRHTFKSLNPVQASQYSYLHGRSNTFKNTYTAVLSVGQLADDNRMLMFRTKKSQHSPVTRVGNSKEDTLTHNMHNNPDCDLETRPSGSNNHSGQPLKTTHELIAGRSTLPTISKDDDTTEFKKSARPTKRLRSVSSKVSSDALPVIAPLDKGTYKRSVSGISGVSSLQAKVLSTIDKTLAARNPNPQTLKGDSMGLQKKIGVHGAASLTNVLKHRDPSQQLLGAVHAANIVRPSPTLQLN